MKVTQNIMPGVTQLDHSNVERTTGAKENRKVNQLAVPHGSAAVEISDQAKWMKQATDIVKTTPHVRAERVQELKKKIKDGTYQVDNAGIADKLIDEHLNSDFGKNRL